MHPKYRRLIIPLALTGLALLVLQFGVRHFSDLGNAAASVRGGAFHVLFAALLLQVLGAPIASVWSRIFRSSPLVTLGKYSYGLYVYYLGSFSALLSVLAGMTPVELGDWKILVIALLNAAALHGGANKGEQQ